MNVDLFSSLVAAFVVGRLIEPGVDRLRSKLWGDPRAGAKAVAFGASAGGTGLRATTTPPPGR